MSWLFGLNKNQQGGANLDLSAPVQDPSGGQDGSGPSGPNKGPLPSSPGYRSEAYSFDSTALERAATAAKVKTIWIHS